MEQYGNAAVLATRLLLKGGLSPSEAWRIAVSRVTDSPTSQDEGCPRAAYLGLCSAGLILGIPHGKYTRLGKNAGYAIRAHSILRSDPKLANDKSMRTTKSCSPWPNGYRASA